VPHDKETKSQNELLEVVREAFDRGGRWPTRQYVEAVLDQDHHLDLDDALQSAPRALIYSAGTQEGSEVILTVAGLAAAGAREDVRHFIEALRWCVAEQMGFRPSDPGATEEVGIVADQFKSEWAARGERVSAVDLIKLRAMLTTEGVFSGIGGEDGKWTVTLNRRCVLPYRDVRTIEDYLAVKVAAAAPPIESFPESPEGELTPVEPLSPRTDLDDLPVAVRAACANLFADGHFGAGVLEAVKVMRDVLQEASGLDLDGEKLAGKALSPKDPLVIVGDLSTETGRSRQRGVLLIAQGIFAAARNPLAHQRIVVPPAEGRRVVAMVAFVVDAIESRQQTQEPP
jgi:uncharacterized protein (TIGR02391 family)